MPGFMRVRLSLGGSIRCRAEEAKDALGVPDADLDVIEAAQSRRGIDWLTLNEEAAHCVEAWKPSFISGLVK